MTDYVDRRGHRHRLGRPLGSGGEGTVYELAGSGTLVAKIFHQPLRDELADKLDVLTGLADPVLRRCAALPVELLSTTSSGPITGLLMPRLQGFSEIHTLYSPAQRKVQFPDKDWGFLVHVSLNLVAAVHAIHDAGLVIADVNQGNVLVSPRGTVCFIDCDSFQVTQGERVYACDVGVSHFTPPELQGQAFRGLIRTQNHDRFGLAVLIFHLLCMGRHPFAGRHAGPGEPPGIETAIAQGLYAYSQRPGPLQPPPWALIPQAVMPRIADLLERALASAREAPEVRPTEKEWYEALGELKTQLRPCPADLGHKYPNILGSCPWCRLEREGAPNLFASVTAHLVERREAELSASIDEFWQPILELQQQSRSLGRVRLATPPPAKSGVAVPADVERNQAFGRLVAAVALASLVGAGALWGVPAARVALLLAASAFALWGFVLHAWFGLRSEVRRRQRELVNAIERLQAAEREATLLLENARHEFDQLFRHLDLTKAEIDGLQALYQQELRQLDQQRDRRQLEAFLQAQWIGPARIPHFSESRKSLLLSFGVETAHDINEIRLRNIDGLEPSSIAALLDWKQALQQQYPLRPRERIANVDRNTILARYLRRREELERVLINGHLSLEAVLNEQRVIQTRCEQQFDAAANAAWQAEVDVVLARRQL